MGTTPTTPPTSHSKTNPVKFKEKDLMCLQVKKEGQKIKSLSPEGALDAKILKIVEQRNPKYGRCWTMAFPPERAEYGRYYVRIDL